MPKFTNTGSILERLGYLTRSLGFIWAASRKWTVGWICLLSIQGLLPVAIVYLTKRIVDSVAAAAGTSAPWNSMTPILTAGALLGGVLLLSELLGNGIQWIRGIQAELLRNHISSLILRKSVEADLAFYESAEFYDHLHRARDESGHRPILLLENMGSALQNSVTLAAMATVLLPYGLWLPAALVISTVPAVCVVLRFSMKHHRLWHKNTAEERRSWYYDWLLTSEEPAAEMRLFDLGDHFRNLHRLLRQRLFRERMKITRNETLAQLSAAVAGVGITGGAMVWMVWRVVHGAVTLGDLALFYQAFNKGQGLMRSLLQNVGHIYSNSLFLGNLFEFLALKPRVVSPAYPAAFPMIVRQGISMENVGFRYPGCDHFALKDFNLRLPAGKITALVGTNGAGKSTLIKLICRFYDPDEGSIRLDGTDIRDFRLEELRHAITVLFQEPVRYNNTAAENISFGNLRMNPSRLDIESAASAAGAESLIVSMSEGYDTLLGKEFENGEELSVGQWQRIALARAFLRKAPVLLLDEPTSAMDSWAEADWLRRIRDYTCGRTCLIITHRFSTAMVADIIHVMESGKIVESGSHEDLLAMKGLYERGCRSQNIQARKYAF